MQHSHDEIERAARRFEQLAEEFDPHTPQADPADDLRQVAAISETVRAEEARLRESVNIARALGRSWSQIAVALGVTRQAARQRFADETPA